jgi:zinc/manganese transport system permease protein
MIGDFLSVMMLPFLACLVFAGIHAYLGYHVIQRQVIFVDLALAQIAVLGASLSLVFGYGFESPQSYWLSLLFTIIGASIFALTRSRKEIIPQEAIIGIVYAVSAALVIMVLSRSGEGDEHIRHMLAGNVLLVRGGDVLKTALIYAVVGFFHWIYRKKFFLISENYEAAYTKGEKVRLWDFLFYISFGIVITSSVKIAGVLLVFSFLIVPPVCAMLISQNLIARICLGWAVGFVVSILGMTLSYYLNFPTGASVVSMLGLVLAVISVLKKWKASREL